MIGIYKIENKITHQVYIGQSLDINRRIKQHLHSKDTPIDFLIQKYGANNFAFEIVEECAQNELNEKEKYWIDYYNSYEDGYNKTRGGKGKTDAFFKLNIGDIKEIYNLLLNSQLPQYKIANLFNVGEDTISEINQGKSRIQSGYTFPLRNNKKEKVEKKPKPVFNLSKEQLIIDFVNLKSFASIGRKYGVSPHPVRDVANKYGFTAKALKNMLFKQEIKPKIVIQMDMFGNIIKEFSSTKKASREMYDGHIKQVCDGKRKSSLGYKYKYKN